MFMCSLATIPYSDTGFVLCELRAVAEETFDVIETLFSVR